MKLIDIGINVNSQFKDDILDVLHNAKKHFVEDIILTTVDAPSFLKNIELCNIESPVSLFTTWGLHPHRAKELDSFIEQTEPLFALNPDCVKAVGEIGLDFFRMISTKEEQEKAMNYFLDYSKEKKLPLFLHERQSFSSFYAILKEHKIENKGVVHCFTGNKHEARAYLDLGMHIGITGWLTDERRNADLLDAMQYIPLDRIMIETDSPYLKPRAVNKRSIRNEPAYLIHVLKKVAEVKKVPIEELAKILYNNSVEFFNIDNLSKKITP